MKFIVALLVSLAAGTPAMAQTGWKAGVAKTAITPREPIWMAGFGFRDKVSEGVRQEIYVRALALSDGAKPAVIVTLDLAGIGRTTAEEIAGRCRTRFAIPRDRLVLNVSHTHSGPVSGLVPMPLYDLTAEQRGVVDRYTAELIDKVVGAVGSSLERLAPASLSFEQGLAGIAVNRRRVGRRGLPGPVDHDVPTLAVRDPAGALRAIVVGYACHATMLSDYKISNDWPGFALEAMEKERPGATALFVTGCGADANAFPRGGEELARKRGETLAAAAAQVLGGKMRPVNGPLRTAFETVETSFDTFFTGDALRKRLEDKVPALRTTARYLLAILDRDGKFPDRYPYPVQVWQFGKDLKFIALGGEVVVDYSLRLKQRYGFDNTWVAGYSNDVLAYIPSRRVLEEGGYEGGDAMVYFGHGGRFAPSVEERIVGKVEELVQRTR